VDESGLTDYLSDLALAVGWIIIYLNSLEDDVSGFIRDAILRDAIKDERMDVFLTGVLFSAKARALLDLYDQMIECGGVAITDEGLREVDVLLRVRDSSKLVRTCGLDRNEAWRVRARQASVQTHRHQPPLQTS